MLGLAARFLFTSTAVAPVVLVYAYALAHAGKWHWALYLLVSAVALVLIAIAFLRLCLAKLAVTSLRLVSAETADQENVAFLLLYISPLFTQDVTTLNFSIAIPVAILFVLVVMAGNNYHFNPLLNIFGWHFYKVDTDDSVSRVLISRRSIRNVVDRVAVVQLTDYVLMEKGAY